MFAEDFFQQSSDNEEADVQPLVSSATPSRSLWDFPKKVPNIPTSPLEQTIIASMLNGYWVRDFDLLKATDSSVFSYFIHQLRHLMQWDIQKHISKHHGRYLNGDTRLREQHWFFLLPSTIREFEEMYADWRRQFSQVCFPDNDRDATKGWLGKKPTKKMWADYRSGLQKNLHDTNDDWWSK